MSLFFCVFVFVLLLHNVLKLFFVFAHYIQYFGNVIIHSHFWGGGVVSEACGHSLLLELDN